MQALIVAVRAVGIFVVCMVVFNVRAASGPGYPNKPIRVVTNEAGGGADFTARLVAQGLTGSLGQQVIVDNRGSGAVAGPIVTKAPPDGYTLIITGIGFWIGPLLMQNMPYDPVRGFAPITLAVSSPNILVVHPAVAANSARELIALAKSRPGELNYASGVAGAPNHLAAELFKSMAGVNVVRVAYKGAGPAVNALLGGQVQLMFSNAAAVMSQVKSGRLRALAVTSAHSSALTPGLPTLASSGLPGYESATTVGVFAPAGTPAPLVNRLNSEIVTVLGQAEVKERFFNTGTEIVGSSPEQFAATMKSDMARLGKVIKDAGINAD